MIKYDKGGRLRELRSRTRHVITETLLRRNRQHNKHANGRDDEFVQILWNINLRGFRTFCSFFLNFKSDRGPIRSHRESNPPDFIVVQPPTRLVSNKP